MSESNRQQPGQVTNVASEATQHVAGTAKEQAQQVVVVSKEQARKAAGQIRNQVQDEADTQTRRLAQGLRGFADDLSSMSTDTESGSAAQGLVREAAKGGHRAADWLERRGVDGLLADMRSFARRRPGTFLVGAAVAGFGIGRLARSTAKAETGHSYGTSPATSPEPGVVNGPRSSTDRWE